MKKLLLALALSTAALLPAASALAADLDVPPPPTEELRQSTYDWTGLYVGAWVGATCIDGTLTDNAGPTDWEMSGCGWKGGALAGYNHQFNNFVLGLEADWGTTGNIATNEEAGGDFAFSMDHIATFRGRWGVAFDDTLLFATGGVAYARGDLDGINGAATPDHIKGDHWGWTVGGGVEHAVTDNLRLRLDYLFTRFKGDDYTKACCDVSVHDFDDHEVRLGAIWAF
ncbi:outer membrane protein [Aestuariivirga sp.]|uniref:outer membrane protein n=1 Tax=Aestuariivirga sp. TaxID=2650926 RepID=UPI0039E4BD64